MRKASIFRNLERMQTRIIPHADALVANDLAAMLVARCVQFAVSPFPNDLQSKTATGWIFSYPDEPAAPQPEKVAA